MADNYVRLSIKATDEGATVDLDALQARLDGLKADRASVTVDVDDKDGVARLTRIDAQIEDLSAKVARPRVSLAGAARAEAQMAALDLSMDKLKEKADEEEVESGGAGVLSRFFLGKGGSGGGFLSGAVGKLPVIGEQLGSIAEKLGESGEEGGGDGGGMAESLGSISGSAGGIAAVAVAIGAAVTEADALASGLVAAGLGVASFGALAYPTFSKIIGAVGDTKSQLAKLPAPIRQAVGGIKDLESTYKAMAARFQGPALKVFGDGLKIVNGMLPYLGEFANAAAGPVDKLMKMLNQDVRSKGFSDFMRQMSGLVGPVIGAIGSGMQGIGKDVADLLTIMSTKDVVNGFNIAFRLLGAAIEIVIGIVRVSMATWDALTAAVRWVMRAFDDTRHAIAEFADAVARDFDDVRHNISGVGNDFESAFDTVRHAVATAGHAVATGFDAMRHGIASAVTGTLSWVESHWKQIVAWLADPVGMAVYEIRTHTRQIAGAFDDARHEVAAILAGMRHDIASAFDAVRHDIAAALDDVRHEIAAGWDNARHATAAFLDWIPHAVAGAFDDVRHAISAAFDGVRHAVSSGWDDVRHATAAGTDAVVAEVRRLPGQILGVLERLPGQMLTIGRNIIDGLIHGIESAAADIPGIMKGLASDVESYFTDPLKIFSPSKVFEAHGQNVVQGLINGLRKSAPQLKAAMGSIAGTVAGTPLTAGAGAAGHGTTAGGRLDITFRMAPGSTLLKAMQAEVRGAGGDPGMFQGKVAYR